MRLLFLICIVLACFNLCAFCNERDPAINIESSGSYKISSKLTYSSVGTKAVSPALAFRNYRAHKFIPVKQTNNDFINDGLINSEKWFALSLQNNADNEINVVLEFICSGANDVKCWTVNSSQQIQELSSSENNKAIFKGLLGNSETFTVPLIKKDRTLLLIHAINKGQLLYLPATLYTLGYFTTRNTTKNNFLGIVQGIFLFIIIFNLLIFLSTFEKYTCFIYFMHCQLESLL